MAVQLYKRYRLFLSFQIFTRRFFMSGREEAIHVSQRSVNGNNLIVFMGKMLEENITFLFLFGKKSVMINIRFAALKR